MKKFVYFQNANSGLKISPVEESLQFASLSSISASSKSVIIFTNKLFPKFVPTSLGTE
ncbi:MAG: hypothetical protein K0B81_01255 [Candidatus Cloacimonetes bacterium]|nr:hypothetical protein [Candidatus Cloacimonadota bacterium]